ncbi:MAG: phosphotransferase [Acidobacteriaceae bacterium]|nr:phosphotransferase [Acidobacteriaceae bacterium]
MPESVPDTRGLSEFITSRRWFRSKTRNIAAAEVEDVIHIPGYPPIQIVGLTYSEGDRDLYVVTGDQTEALDDAAFRAQLLRAFHQGSSYRGKSGELVFRRTSAFQDAPQNLESSVSRAEQSNTSVIFGDQFILKLFRKIEPGTNPDVEIGAFLTDHGFKHTPAVLGTLEYRSQNGDVYSAGILQQFVRNQGDAWKYTLDSIAGNRPVSAGLLGQRTAEMHLALAQGGNPDFKPEAFTPEAGRQLYDDMLSQADIAFETLRRKQATLSGEAATLATKLLHLETRVTERFSALRDQQINTARIRIHADYHLGQVLWTGNDFMIIDFEGEPARPLHQRRAKSLAMRDVAGMLRSFQYAAFIALPDGKQADAWNQRVSAEYLEAYFRSAQGGVFLPGDDKERHILLDAFVLHKALYEVAYEMNNRPDWVHIPLRGILSLVA